MTVQTNHNGLAIEVLGLTKKFGDFVAVNNVSFEVRAGEILGVAGSLGGEGRGGRPGVG